MVAWESHAFQQFLSIDFSVPGLCNLGIEKMTFKSWEGST